MKQAEYLMRTKKRPIFMPNYQASMIKSNDMSSWENKAFAEDAVGAALGGCIWPPRCYSCGFCKREFRSAQALGGHMNVHRRDRAAMLKQFLSSHEDVDNDDAFRHKQQHHVHTKPSTCIQSLWESSQNLSSTLSSSGVSALSTGENSSDYTFLSLKLSPSTYNLLGSDRFAVRFPDRRPNNSDHEQNQREQDPTCLSHDHSVDTELFVGLNSIISQNPPFSSCSGDETTSSKGSKTTVSAFSFLIESGTNGRYDLQSKVSGPNSSFMGDVDLELRLG